MAAGPYQHWGTLSPAWLASAAQYCARGSAPWADGLPHELFRRGCDIVAELVGRAFRATRLGEGWVELVLGPNVELLAWAPKK
eukprot:11089382-Alexandrium_andersonii.AAC.1